MKINDSNRTVYVSLAAAFIVAIISTGVFILSITPEVEALQGRISCLETGYICIEGQKGSEGKRGATGAQGEQGKQGPSGSSKKGSQGSQGHLGPRGPRGKPGVTTIRCVNALNFVISCPPQFK